jgi:hypothetical protein
MPCTVSVGRQRDVFPPCHVHGVLTSKQVREFGRQSWVAQPRLATGEESTGREEGLGGGLGKGSPAWRPLSEPTVMPCLAFRSPDPPHQPMSCPLFFSAAHVPGSILSSFPAGLPAAFPSEEGHAERPSSCRDWPPALGAVADE